MSPLPDTVHVIRVAGDPVAADRRRDERGARQALVNGDDIDTPPGSAC
jgi:hypothetical protein